MSPHLPVSYLHTCACYVILPGTQAFTGVMRDMGSTAVITTHGGIALWQVKRNRNNIKATLPTAKIGESALASLADFIGPSGSVTVTRFNDGDEVGQDEAAAPQNLHNGRSLYLMELIQGEKVSYMFAAYHASMV